MFFNDIIGQDSIKQHLINSVKEGRIPHAMLFCGPAGTGKLPMAAAFAQYLVCSGKNSQGFFSNEAAEEPCGQCPSCAKANKLVHPDIHFILPVYKKESGRNGDTYPQTDDFIFDWRKAFLKNPYIGLEEWLRAIGADKQRGEIYVAQANEIIRKLNLRSSEGGYRVVILWMPEKMNDSCANKLLKLIEEPPSETVFLMVSENVENVLPTIQSRAQRINFPPMPEADIRKALCERLGTDDSTAAQAAHTSEGKWPKAVEAVRKGAETTEDLESFIQLMRLAYGRKAFELKLWSDEMATLGRVQQRQFLQYAQRMIRESFVCNFHIPQLNYMNRAENNFTQRFAPFVNERNVEGISQTLADAERDIESNVNAKMVFFDLSLKMIMLLKQN